MNLAENRIEIYLNTNLRLLLVHGSPLSHLKLFEAWTLCMTLFRSETFNGLIIRYECPT
jgi:hypothetical protein